MSLVVHAYVDIQAPSAIVWAILVDFPSYKRWNPCLLAILGQARDGERLSVTSRRPGHAPRVASVVLTLVREPREMRWRQVRPLPFLFATERQFRIEPRGADSVRFHQSERLMGLFAAHISTARRLATEDRFRAMNNALKARAERFAGQLAAGDGGRG